MKLDGNSFNGIRQTGRVLSLDYVNVPFVRNPYATRTESVTPFLINYYGGSILLTPSSDVWVDQVVLDAKKATTLLFSLSNTMAPKHAGFL